MINRFYDSEGCPICCPFCCSKKIDDSIQSIDGGVISEIQYNCSRCKDIIGYWAYGYYDPYFKKQFDCTIFSMRYWKLFFIRLEFHIWRKHQCLKKLTKSPEELYEEKSNRNESR